MVAVLPLIVLGIAIPARSSDWASIGPYGGHALKIVIDPDEHNHLYVATRNGKIYQSFDAGSWWVPLPFRLGSGSSIRAFIAGPSGTDDLYVGIAQDSSLRAGDTETGVYKSEDGGAHWSMLQPTKGWSVLSLAMNAADSQIVVAGTDDGVFRSMDSGTSWRRISPVNHPDMKGIVSVAMDSKNSEVLYAGTPHLPWKTSDGGKQWRPTHEGMSDDSDIFSILVDRTNSQHLIVGACSGVYFSNSGGVRWKGISAIPEASRRTYQIVQDPANAKVFYAATAQGLWKSNDGGLTWKRPNPYQYVVNSIAIDPHTPETLYLATDRSGILKSLDGGVTLEPVNEGFVNRNLSALVSNDALFVSSAYDREFGGIFTSSDSGLTWQLDASQEALHGRNVTSLAVAPGDPQQLAAGSYDGLLLSNDGGQSWQIAGAHSGAENSLDQAPLSKGKINDVAFSPADSTILYAATDRGLFESTDGGRSWTKNAAEDLNTAVYKLALHSSDSRKMLAQTSKGIWISRDRGLEWTLMNLGTDAPFTYDFSFAATGEHLFVATWRGLLQSVDGGREWNTIRGLPQAAARQVLFLRGQSQEAYVLFGESNQVWRSIDGGTEWTPVSNRGLEGLTLLKMSLTPNDGRQLFVISENRGVFRLKPESPELEVAKGLEVSQAIAGE